MDFSKLLKKGDDSADDPSSTMPNDIPDATTSDKLAAYSKYLDASSPDQDMEKNFQNYIQNKGQIYNQASDIVNRSPLQARTPEEQTFLDKNIDPLTQSVMGGGVTGEINNIGSGAKQGFGNLMKYLGHGADAASEVAPAIQNALPSQPIAFNSNKEMNSNTGTNAYVPNQPLPPEPKEDDDSGYETQQHKDWVKLKNKMNA